MNLLEVIAHHGYVVTSLVLFSACCGLPLPLSVVLLTAGAAAQGGSLNLGLVIACAWSAALAGDLLMYLGGRYTGWWLLTNICKFSLNQEACVFGSAHQFYKRGPRALLVAKFVPGLAEVSSVLAGSLSMRPRRFLLLDGVGILLYVTSWSVAGFVFARFLRDAIRWVERVGHVTAAMLGGIVVLYVLWMVLSLLRETRLPKVEKIACEGSASTSADGEAGAAADHCGCALARVLRSGHAADQELDSRGSGAAAGGSAGVGGVHAAAAGLRDLPVLLVCARGDEHAGGADAAGGELHDQGDSRWAEGVGEGGWAGGAGAA